MGEEEILSPGISRRSFVKSSAIAALASVAAGSMPFAEAPESAFADETSEPEESVIWNTCSEYGCGVTICPLQFHVKDGVITYVEGHTDGDSEFGGLSVRPCLRGRSVRRYINNPDRITKPLKRVGPRGSGEFEEISWDEALDLFYEKLKYTIDTYGNEAVVINGGGGTLDCGHSGLNGAGNFDRLMNLIGGFRGTYGTWSCTAADFGCAYTFIGSYSDGILNPGNGSNNGSCSVVAKDADLIVLFGQSVATNRMNGAGVMYDFSQAREKGTRIVWIDVRQGEEMSGTTDEWLPILPGTDGALASALNYVMIDEGLAKEDFLHTYCVGYDEETLPESAQGKNLSYKDYILGTGYDMIPKTPEWAEPITGIPAERIYELARAIGNAKAAFIGRGNGLQRRVNAENTVRSIIMTALISGNFGLPGTNWGGQNAVGINGPWVGDLGANQAENGVQGVIPTTKIIEAIERDDDLTATRDGVIGAETASSNIKFMYVRGSNALTNQNCDVNWAAKVLEDENACEFITAPMLFMTSSAKYCDLIMPDTMCQEWDTTQTLLTSGAIDAIVFGQKVQDPPGECRHEFDWMSEIAERFGVRDEFAAMTNLEMKQMVYESQVGTENWEDLPTWEEGREMGFWWRPASPEPKAAFSDFREDPVANPLPTQSGKVEIYSEALDEIANTWEFDDPIHDIVSAIPMYIPDFEGPEERTDEYPLQVASYKSKIRYHSQFDQNELLRQAHRHVIWINPIDAEPRGIENGDMIRVFNDRGEIHIEARVTPRVIPGAMVMEEGRNRELDENGVDVGGCINTLCSHHWAPLSKFNPSNSILAQAEKL